MSLPTLKQIEALPWIIFAVYWLATWLRVKRTKATERAADRFVTIAVMDYQVRALPLGAASHLYGNFGGSNRPRNLRGRVARSFGGGADTGDTRAEGNAGRGAPDQRVWHGVSEVQEQHRIPVPAFLRSVRCGAG